MRKILIFLLCFCTIFVCFVITSSADEGITPRVPVGSTPTDLTGVTATVPANWSADSGLGIFNINGDASFGAGLSSLAIGYERQNFTTAVPLANSITFSIGGRYTENLTSDISFSITFTAGPDLTNPLLIRWLVDNNATFSGGSGPEPVTYFIPSGYYKLAELPSSGVPSVGGFVVNIEHLFEVPVEVYYSSGVVKQYNYFGFMLTNFEDSNNFSVDFTVQLLDIGNSIRIANLTAVDGVCTSQFYGGITNIYFGEDIVTTDEASYQLISFMFDIDPSFIPVEPDIPDIPINPWAYILEMIIEALKVPLFGYFSVWDIFVTIMGIFILTWLLKLLAGG